ncbi:UV radiation resistance protein and autophagy-related subunit 14-domain-containing protein [Dendryphion nanum]|uniref:Autophagy-related protein 14 n=1 Tax=Dendryphion nanum TaxID=256645 RepID=A0A9P9E690_9PLEO|nr:UV radiation resistance protein and autophagy-related subunit 14-domain-containing protein [Dendryphion nanum]
MANVENIAGSKGNDPPIPPRERPWLLPYNRKLRHLQGIAIRNLTLIPAQSRPRTRTIDDEAIPSTLKSPTKALALMEQRGLAHSRSSSDLKSSEDSARHTSDAVRENGSPKKASRPTMGKGLRRRSTMEWSGASPLTRQRKLEDVIGARMADTFFSLHIDDQTEPVYISEVVEKAMNPNFRFFDLGSTGPRVTRLDKLMIKVWAKNENTKGWQYLIEFTAHLRGLQFIGKTLGNFKHPLPQNCILFHMTDGIYTSFTDLPVKEKLMSQDLAPPKEHPDGRPLNSSSYDALMRLSTLDDCIQDALITRDKLAEDIETILAENREAISTIGQVPEAQEGLRTAEAMVTAQKRKVDAARRRRDELQASIKFRKEKVQAGYEMETQTDIDLESQREKHKETNEAAENIQEEIMGQRRRICEDLQKIFPIEPILGKSLAFTIRGHALPNTEFDDANEAVTAAALGYVAQLVSMLSPYLGILLPYPMFICGSTSTIDDPLAMGTGSQNNPRTYPLFMKGVVRYRFEYGVFLLNKNIEIMSNAIGIRPMDIRQTLPNLKYLLFVATAGKGELPARKAGGIRGLLRQDGVLSRKGSIDSTATASSADAIDLRRNLEDMNKRSDIGKGNGVPIHSKASVQKSRTLGLPGSRLREIG